MSRNEPHLSTSFNHPFAREVCMVDHDFRNAFDHGDHKTPIFNFTQIGVEALS